jgi:pseudouridine kinase
MSKPVVCIGAAFIDELFHTREEILKATTNEASVSKTPGGVARNIAHQLARLQVAVELITVFGNDSDGDWLKSQCLNAGIGIDASMTIDGPSGRYSGILNPDGSLFTALLTHSPVDNICPEHLEKHRDLLRSAGLILSCANVIPASLDWLLHFSKEHNIPFIIEPVSVPPARKMADMDLDGLYLITPNEDELPVLCKGKGQTTREQIDELLDRGVQQVWLHQGAKGSAIYKRGTEISLHACPIEVVDCTGAGDASVAGFILGKQLEKTDEECLRIAHTLSAEILQVEGANIPGFSRHKLMDRVNHHYPQPCALA